MPVSTFPPVYVPPGAQEKSLEQVRAEEAVRQQTAAVAKAKASKDALLYTPQGLRGLFPTNMIGVRIAKKPTPSKSN